MYVYAEGFLTDGTSQKTGLFCGGVGLQGISTGRLVWTRPDLSCRTRLALMMGWTWQVIKNKKK